MTFPVEIRESRGIRTLHFGSDWVQGAMRVSRPWDLELVYTREMMAALLLSADWPRLPHRILQIGLGAGSLTRFIHRYLPEASQTVVELSPAVVGAARQMFPLPPCSDQLVIETADGVAWVAHTQQQFDLILIDGFDADSRSGGLESAAFYQDCRRVLTSRGLLVANLLSNSQSFLQACMNLDRAFEGQTRLLPHTPGGNVIALGAKNETAWLDEGALRERIGQLQVQAGLDLKPLLERLLAQGDGLPFGIGA